MSTTGGNITNLPAQRVPFTDDNNLITREWYRFLFNLFTLTGGGSSSISIDDLAMGPAGVDAAESLLQSAGLSLAPGQYNDMAALQGAYLSTPPAPALLDPGFWDTAPVVSLPDSAFNDMAPVAAPWLGDFGRGLTLRQIRTTLNINNANTDVATIKNLPSKFLVTGFRVFDASTDLSGGSATIGLFTAAAGGGTTVVTAAVLTALVAATDVLAMTIATATTYLTAASLFVRNVAANGSAATISVQLEVLDLS